MEVIVMKDLLCAVVGLIAAGVAVWQIWTFLQPVPKGVVISNTPLFIGIFCVVIALVCGVFFMLGRVNKNEEIHVTE
jgi:uncharacterized membrane protein YidH (DUF202 family)